MALDLTSLRKAIDVLESSISSFVKNQHNNSLSEVDLETIKSGVIQNYEVAYELCWKLMQRWIEKEVSPELVSGKSRQQLYRIAAENQLIADVDTWMDYHHSRNLTAHTYNSENAEKAFEASIKFVHDARHFLQVLEAHND